MMQPIEALDVSHWTGPVTVGHWAQAREDLGVGLAIVGSWHGGRSNPHAEVTLRAARAAGLMTATYIVLSQHLEGDAAVDHARRTCAGEWHSLRFAALDCELDGITRHRVFDAVDTLRHVDDITPIIYTGRWFWASAKHLDNPTWAKCLPLWDSHYDGRATLDTPFRPYGGWDQQTGKQYTNHTPGINADRSVFDGDWQPLQ